MTRLTRQTLALLLALIVLAAAVPGEVGAHAFPIRSDPRVGWTISSSPPSVRIWFDGELEPAFSAIAVYNADKQRVDRGNGKVNPSDAMLLEVDLPPLPPGTYRVVWSVVARDTHRTEGDFPFTIQGKSP